MNQETNVSKNGELNWSVFALINNPAMMKKFKRGTKEYNLYNADAKYYIVFNGGEISCLNYMSTINSRVS